VKKKKLKKKLKSGDVRVLRINRETISEMLLDYFRKQAEVLEHTPWPKEIVGWQMIVQRFGSWEETVKKAGLPLMTTPNTTTKFLLYREEEELQKRIYRTNRAEKKAKSLRKNKERTDRQDQKKCRENSPKSEKQKTPPDTDGEIL
jgi:hypothetical protein